MELIIGSHVSFKSNNQLLGSVQEALSYGANTFMFYTGAPQNTKRGAINDGYTLEGLKLMKENNVSMFGGCLPALLPLPILFALYYVFRNIQPTDGADLSFLFINNVFAMPTSMFNATSIILGILAALSTYIPSLLLSKSMSTNAEDSPMNMGTMNIVMAGMMGFMALQFQPILVIYWIIGGLIQLVQTYFINYLPAKKKADEKAKLEAEKKVYAPKSKKKKK